MPKDSVILGWDFADANEACEEIKKKLPELGLFVYVDPISEDTDQYGFIVSKKELTTKEIMDIAEESWKK